MHKEVLYNNDARVKLKAGIDILSNAVKVTLGPKGRNVIIDKGYSAPHITKDGATVAKSIEVKDPFENMGVQMIKEVASKTNDDSGDGTTTATVLAQSMINSGFDLLKDGFNPVFIKKGIDIAVKDVVRLIDEKSKKILDVDIKSIATISANNDESIGALISDTMLTIGRDGIIIVEESSNIKTTVESVKGIQINKGYISPQFITNFNKMTVELDDTQILILDRKVQNIDELLNVLEYCKKTSKSLFIMANEITEPIINLLIMNNMNGMVSISICNLPEFGETRSFILEDIAILTGATIVNSASSFGSNRHISVDMLGSAGKIVSSSSKTTIINGGGSKELVKERIEQIKSFLKNTEVITQVQRHQERLASLSGGIAVLKIGASSELEMKEKKDRIDDALAATRAAIEEGIVDGGGCTLAQIYFTLYEVKSTYEFSCVEESHGYDIILNSLIVPLLQICSNAGIDGHEVLLKISDTIGYNALTNTYQNLYENGIIDPAMVTRIAIENAASVSSLFLTTACAIANINDNI